MLRVDWAEAGNIFTSYDQPAYMAYETDFPVRFKATVTYAGTTSVLVDDTLSGTNRSGKGEVKLWDYNPIGNPTSTPLWLDVDVEVYDTSNNLLEKRKLPWLLVSTDRTISFRDESGYLMTVNTMYAFYYNGKTYWRRYTGMNIGTVSAVSKDNILLEVWKEDPATGKKYYWFGNESQLPLGTIDLQLFPGDSFTIRVVYKLSNDFINTVFTTPIVGSAASFILNNLTWLVNNAALPLARAIGNLVGIKLEIAKVEVDTTTTPISLIVYYNQDINPVLVLIIIWAGVAALLAWLAAKIVTEVSTTTRVVAPVEMGSRLASENLSLKEKILEYCKGSTNPAKCVSDIVSSMRLNEGDQNLQIITTMSNELQKTQADVGKWKTYTLVAGLGGTVVGLLLAPKAGAVAGAVKGAVAGTPTE